MLLNKRIQRCDLRFDLPGKVGDTVQILFVVFEEVFDISRRIQKHPLPKLRYHTHPAPKSAKKVSRPPGPIPAPKSMKMRKRVK